MIPRRAAALGGAAALLAAALAAGTAGASASCAPAEHAGGEWRMMGYDLGHSRHQAGEALIGPAQAASLAPAWTFSANVASGDTHNEITGYPIVADGCVYIGTSTGFNKPGWVFAINADTGALVWRTRLGNGIYSTTAVDGGRVYAFVSRVGSPYVAALDQATGAVLWERTVDTQPGSDAVSSPVVFDGMVWVGVSGTAAEGDESQRFDFRGKSVLLDAVTGTILAETYSIPQADLEQGFAGGAIWSTISIDPDTKFGYVGTGNPFNYQHEHANTNAVLKIVLDKSGGALGQIAGTYKGDVEEYFPPVADTVQCDEDDPVGVFLGGFECGRLDLDFGAAPNLFVDSSGRKLVGAGQKSGVYHVFDAESMEVVWKAAIGVPSAVGGIVGTPAYDGEAIYSPHTLVGYLVSLDKDSADAAGDVRWAAPVGDGVHWGNPVTSANGVVYTVDLKGFLDAYDAATGVPLLHRPLWLGSGTRTDPTLTWGGATVARNTVYASVGLGITSVGEMPPWPEMPNGFVVAFRPAAAIVGSS